jgi:hypothetical protein
MPGAQMIEEMWPDGKQPQTKAPVALHDNELVSISCNTPGASIGYILSDKEFSPDLNSGWQLYKEPVDPLDSKYIYIMASRIGYTDTPVIVENLKD